MFVVATRSIGITRGNRNNERVLRSVEQIWQTDIVKIPVRDVDIRANSVAVVRRRAVLFENIYKKVWHVSVGPVITSARLNDIRTKFYFRVPPISNL